MRDEDDRGVDRLELALEPLEARDVEVVRRLVEEQQIGVAAERAGQRGSRQLSARECRERALEVVRREAEVARDRVEPLSPGVAARVLEARLRLGIAPECRRLVVAGGHRLFEPAQLPLGGGQVGRAREDVVAERGAALGGRALVMKRDPGALGHRELAPVQLGLAVQDPEQGRLARAVRARERDAVPAADLERDPVEERVTGELLGGWLR